MYISALLGKHSFRNEPFATLPFCIKLVVIVTTIPSACYNTHVAQHRASPSQHSTAPVPANSHAAAEEWGPVLIGPAENSAHTLSVHFPLSES